MTAIMNELPMETVQTPVFLPTAHGGHNHFRNHAGLQRTRDGMAELILGSLRTADPSTPYNEPNHTHADRRHYDQMGIILVDVVAAAFNDPVATDDQERNHAY
jgi:hypothetical protein